MKHKLLAIVGPTGVGKTELSIHLAKRFGGEIISGDSMQVYKGMDIGTAKIKPEEMACINHHLIDIIQPEHTFSAGAFQALAKKTIAALNEQQILPILVGGTGLYVQGITQDFQFAEDGDREVRMKWEAYLQTNGAEALHEILAHKDPSYAKQIHPHNTRRVIRALELIETTGQSMLNYQGEWKKESPYDLLMIGLTMERSRLYDRLDKRVDQMMEEGLLNEVQNLLNKGIHEASTSLQAIGYKEFIPYIKGELSLVEAVNLLKRNTRRFAKRQLTWFRRMSDITWFDVTQEKEWLKNKENIASFVQESYFD